MYAKYGVTLTLDPANTSVRHLFARCAACASCIHMGRLTVEHFCTVGSSPGVPQDPQRGEGS